LTNTRTVTLAAISGAHGVTGEVRLKLFAESLDSIKLHKSFNDGSLTLKSLRPNKDGAIARFAEITDRNMAEKLRSTLLTVPRDALANTTIATCWACLASQRTAPTLAPASRSKISARATCLKFKSLTARSSWCRWMCGLCLNGASRS
jgi:hypothetical protein